MVYPDVVADAPGVEAEVECEVLGEDRAEGEGGGDGVAEAIEEGVGVGVGVGNGRRCVEERRRVVVKRAGRGEVGLRELHRVGHVQRQVVEQVEAGAIGGGAGDVGSRAAVVQVNDDAGDGRLTGVLNAVAVQVHPDVVADFARDGAHGGRVTAAADGALDVHAVGVAPRVAVLLPVVVQEERLGGQDDVGGDGIGDLQDDGQDHLRVNHRTEGDGRRQLGDAPGEDVGCAGSRPGGDDRPRIVAPHRVCDQAQVGGEGVGDDQIVAGQRSLVGDDDGVCDQVVGGDDAGVVLQSVHGDVVEVGT